jgi:hypothetical protein
MNKTILVLAYSILTATSQASGLLNPDFEEGKTGWNLFGDSAYPSKWQIVPIHNTGNYGLMADNWAKYISQSFDPIPTQSIIELSFATLTDVNGKTNVSLLYSDSTIQTFYFDTTSYVWQTRDLTASLLSNNYLQEIKVITWDGNINTGMNIDTTYDTFKLETSSSTARLADFDSATIPEPSSKSLLFYGLIALLLIRNQFQRVL